jgi:hypothetical protein
MRYSRDSSLHVLASLALAFVACGDSGGSSASGTTTGVTTNETGAAPGVTGDDGGGGSVSSAPTSAGLEQRRRARDQHERGRVVGRDGDQVRRRRGRQRHRRHPGRSGLVSTVRDLWRGWRVPGVHGSGLRPVPRPGRRDRHAQQLGPGAHQLLADDRGHLGRAAAAQRELPRAAVPSPDLDPRQPREDLRADARLRRQPLRRPDDRLRGQPVARRRSSGSTA